MLKSLKANFLGKSAIVIATTLFVSAPAMAADYPINVRKCPAAKGSLKIDTSNAGVWSSVKSKDQTSVFTSMVSKSNCFTIANAGSYAQYTLRFGALTQGEYAAGASSFSGRSVLDPAPVAAGGIAQAGGIPQSGGGIPQGESGGGGGFGLSDVQGVLNTAQGVRNTARGVQYQTKSIGNSNFGSLDGASRGLNRVDSLSNTLGSVGNMFGSSAPKDRYAYVEIVNSSGQTVARGFGHNARHDLSFNNFVGADTIAKSKKSKRQAGALFNALNDAQNKILAPGFGSPIR